MPPLLSDRMAWIRIRLSTNWSRAQVIPLRSRRIGWRARTASLSSAGGYWSGSTLFRSRFATSSGHASGVLLFPNVTVTYALATARGMPRSL